MERTVQELADRMIAASVWRKLPGIAEHQHRTGLSPNDYVSLVNQASILALSEDATERTLAYEIATHTLNLGNGNSPALVAAVDFILARLGNFPGRELLRKNYRNVEKRPVPPLLRLEAGSREIENTIPDFNKPLTDFQVDLLVDMSLAKAVSVSAPTSAGKSFVLTLQIIRRLRAGRGVRVGYIVPTRALIREVMTRLRDELTAANLPDVSIRCVPQPANPDETTAGVIYVLTQERLMSLLHSTENNFALQLLVVDEAHNIGDGARGILLQTAIEQMLRISKDVEVIFASPPIANPDLFLTLFKGGSGKVRREKHSPVAQNYIAVDPVHSDHEKLHFTLLRNGQQHVLGNRTTSGYKWNVSSYRRRAQLAHLITHETDGCLVYANGASEAERLATELVKFCAESDPHPEVTDFIAYISEQIHEEYPLIPALRRGVGFHHGEMPATVRGGVEDLFQNKRLRFICCTSTLLQGVNLPARHLVVDRPRRGNGHPLTTPEFTNLAGRAGRLRKEFHGNVWCLAPANWPIPPRNSASAVEVRSAFEKTLLTNSEQLKLAATDPNYADRRGDVTTALGRILAEHVLGGMPLEIPADHPSPEMLKAAVAAIASQKLQLPPIVFSRNGSLLPLKLESLYAALLAEPDLDAYILTHPYKDDAFDKLNRVLRLLQIVFENQTHHGHRFDATLGLKWMKQYTLRELINGRRRWQLEHNRPVTPISKNIRDIIHTIERRIRFTLVRNLRAYQDVLARALIARNESSKAEDLLPLHLYLECGASSTVVLSLISLGFSRTAALILNRKNMFPSDASPERCRAILMVRLPLLQVPATVRREAIQILGLKSGR